MSGKLGIHLSPTMETNFVRGYRVASTRMCSNARSLWGMLGRRISICTVNKGTAHTYTYPSLYKKHTTPVPRSLVSSFSLTTLASVTSLV